MRVEPYTYWITSAEAGAELFQDGNIINIKADAQVFSFNDLIKVYAVGSKQNPVRGKAGFETKLYLVDAYTIK
jgi:hypothetical protein